MWVGDVGYLDEDGYLFLTDRRHHVVISGGVNIYPRETEDALVCHPKVMDAAVFGIPDEDLGQVVMAVVEPVDMNDATGDFGDELLRWLQARIARYKCPRSIAFEPSSLALMQASATSRELVLRYSPSPGLVNRP